LPLFSNIKEGIQKSVGRDFTLEHFQQIIYLVPKFYIHRWEYRTASKKYELVIEIPSNAKDIVEYPDLVNTSSEGIEGTIHSSILDLRKQGIRKAILHHIISLYEDRK
jgi:DNA replication factor CDT1 like